MSQTSLYNTRSQFRCLTTKSWVESQKKRINALCFEISTRLIKIVSTSGARTFLLSIIFDRYRPLELGRGGIYSGLAIKPIIGPDIVANKILSVNDQDSRSNVNFSKKRRVSNSAESCSLRIDSLSLARYLSKIGYLGHDLSCHYHDFSRFILPAT